MISSRWLVRTAYGIPGDGISDFLVGCFLPCCSANQLLQTTKEYGSLPNSGTVYNRNKFESQLGKCDSESCLLSLCCAPCEVADIAKKGLGMPWCMACFLLNPCSIRNLIRYQYRVHGNDLMEELCAPCSLFGGGTCLMCTFACVFCPCVSLAMYPTYVSFLIQLKTEVSSKGSGDKERYLMGFCSSNSPLHSSALPPSQSIEYHSPLTSGENKVMGSDSQLPTPQNMDI